VILGACGGGAELPTGPVEGGTSVDAGFEGGGGTGGTIIVVPPAPDSGCDDCDDGAAGTQVTAVCGDGKVNRAEEKCDDGNTQSKDGCTGNCEQIEANFACPTPGAPCVSTVRCGDGKVTAGIEDCDDANGASNDGCSAECHVERGWACEVVGQRCAPVCGDGILTADEECEFYGAGAVSPADGGAAAEGGAAEGGVAPVGGRGCAANCKIESGWDCSATTMTCARAVCGNGVVERGEQCDDRNTEPFDGCFNCVKDPSCTAGACQPVCGDGRRYATEACDDGNSRDGDGCSSKCAIEMGYACNDVAPAPSETLSLPVIYRDFVGKPRDHITTAARDAAAAKRAAAAVPVLIHPDFNVFYGGGIAGVVAPGLGSDGRPVYTLPNPGEPANFTGAANFAKWYRNDPAYNRTIVGNIALARQGDVYVFDSGRFFGPLDSLGFVAEGLEAPPAYTELGDGLKPHNYSFTTETRFWFEYGGGETFTFSGDDDVWVFVGGQLVIDLGGLHNRQEASFTLDTTGKATMRSGLGSTADIDLKLVRGNVYEVAMFHAEREERDSNFKLTLKDFNKPKSNCGSICGDGIVTRDEVCDDGPGGNIGAYGGCMPGCKKRAPYCGDALVEPNRETCDDGVNLSEYGGCAPGCTLGPSCGDGVVQSKFEQCDDGTNAGGYGKCAARCVLGPHCGDGIVESPIEQCDDNNRSNVDTCDNSCRYSVVP